MSIFITLVLVIAGVMAGLQAWRWSDNRYAARIWAGLEQLGQYPASIFNSSIVEDLPEPARRCFLYTIKAGTPVRTVTEISTSGEIGLGTQDKPNYMPMQAKQILAPPHGLVWNLNTGRGLMRVSGSDGFDGDTSWVRFWLM